MDFVNPGLLDTYAKFKREFEGPIVRGRQPGATKKVVEMGVARGESLGKITGEFVLRRTSEILEKYLPMKCTPILDRIKLTVDEYVVFCAPTGLQQRVYKALLESRGLQRCLYEGDMQSHLKAITLMRKICNAVSLVVAKAEKVCSRLAV